MNDKLIITKPSDKSDAAGQVVRVSTKAYALLEDLAARSGRSRSYIANKMIEFAFDRVEIKEKGEDDEADC